MKKQLKSKVFIFRYDPDSSFEGMFEEFWIAVDGKLSSIEPHVVRSNSLEALSTNMTKNRLRLFAALVERRPTNLTELAHFLQKDYALVRRDARILEGMGLIKLEKVGKEAHNKQGSKVKFSEVKPVPLYKRIIFDFPVAEPVSVKKKFLNSHRPRFAV